MEFSFNDRQVAALVLGYLKENKCSSTARRFLKESTVLKEPSKNPYMINRSYSFTPHFYDETSLLDFLQEYAAIYTIVQSHWERRAAREIIAKRTLIEKLVNLLEKEELNPFASTSESRETMELAATSFFSLPGNEARSGEKSRSKLLKRQKRKKSTETETDDMPMPNSRSVLEQSVVHEFVNKVLSSSDSTQAENAPASSRAAKELEALIKSVVQKSSDSETVASATQSTQASSMGNTGGVYVYDGTLDNYLESTAAKPTPTFPTNPMYLNTGNGLIMMPTASTQPFFVVQNQPLLNVAAAAPTVPNLLTNQNVLSMPTMIVTPQVPNQNTLRKIASKPDSSLQDVTPKRFCKRSSLKKKKRSSLNKSVAEITAPKVPAGENGNNFDEIFTSAIEKHFSNLGGHFASNKEACQPNTSATDASDPSPECNKWDKKNVPSGEINMKDEDFQSKFDKISQSAASRLNDSTEKLAREESASKPNRSVKKKTNLNLQTMDFKSMLEEFEPRLVSDEDLDFNVDNIKEPPNQSNTTKEPSSKSTEPLQTISLDQFNTRSDIKLPATTLEASTNGDITDFVPPFDVSGLKSQEEIARSRERKRKKKLTKDEKQSPEIKNTKIG